MIKHFQETGEKNKGEIFNLLSKCCSDYCNNFDAVKILVNLIFQYRWNLNSYGYEDINNVCHPLYRDSSFKIFKYLVDHGMNVNFLGIHHKMTLLQVYVTRRNFKKIKYLLEHGADPNLFHPLHPYKKTLIHMVCKSVIKNQLELIKLLLKYHVNLNVLDENDQLPIDVVSKTNYDKIIKLFPSELHPSNKQKNDWLECLRLLVEKDDYPEGEIIQVVQWARQDSFWAKNVNSILKLRRTDKDGVKYYLVFREHMKKKPISNGTPEDVNDQGKW